MFYAVLPELNLKIISNGDYCRGEISCKLKSLFIKFFVLSHCKFSWLHWKLDKIKNEQNELDELKYSKTLIQTTSYAHWHAFLYLHAQTCIKTFIYLSHLKSEKKTEPNQLNELEYSKTLTQVSSYAHKYVFLYLHAQTRIKTFIYLSHLKSEKKTELNELNELEYSKTPSQMSNYAHWHA